MSTDLSVEIPSVLPTVETDGLRWRRVALLLADLVFLGALVVVAIARYGPLADRGAPTGNDWANMLTVGHAYLGHRVPGTVVNYPPLVPLLVVAVANLLPLTKACALLGSIGSVLPALGGYLALRGTRRTWAIGLGMGALLLASSSAEQATWGGFAELFGLACLPPMLVAASLTLRRPTVRRSIVFGTAFLLLAASSHIVFFEGLVALGVLLLLDIVLSPRDLLVRARRGVVWLGIASAPSLVLVPVYLPLINTLQLGQAASHSQTFSLTAKFNYLFREGPTFWLVCIVIAGTVVFAVVALRFSQERPYLQAGSSLVIAAALLGVLVHNVRFFYLVPVAAAFNLALVLTLLPRFQSPTSLERARFSVPVVGLVACALLMVNLGLEANRSFSLYRQQVTFYGSLSLTPGTLQSVEWIKEHTPSDSLVAVSATTGLGPIGWWVTGVATRKTLVQSDPQYLYFPSQQRQAREAQKIFGSFPSLSSLQLASKLNVAYLLVVRSWPGYDPAATAVFLRAYPSLAVFSNDGAVVLRVPSPGSI